VWLVNGSNTNCYCRVWLVNGSNNNCQCRVWFVNGSGSNITRLETRPWLQPTALRWILQRPYWETCLGFKSSDFVKKSKGDNQWESKTSETSQQSLDLFPPWNVCKNRLRPVWMSAGYSLYTNTLHRK
jgi:hypothetical protein